MSTRNTPVYGAPLKCWRCFCRPPSAWTLHPAATTPAPAVVEPVEKKVPKGVPLQFDINSVGKPVRTRPPMSGPQKGGGVALLRLPSVSPQQTSMTLNERFRILKDKRAATLHTAKGSRFVTVG